MNTLLSNRQHMPLTFKKATLADRDTIFSWLQEPHIMEFWDNSQAHREDIMLFLEGKQDERTYFDGIFDYWMGFMDEKPFSFLLTSEMKADQNDLTPLHHQHLSKEGKTITLDFGIGNIEFLGKKLAAPTLEAFVKFYSTIIDPKADTFIIDPNENNPRAQHVYSTAGFVHVGNYITQGGFFNAEESLLMVKKI